jgi:hypothetical protein
MVSEEYIKKVMDKFVHVDFLNTDRKLDWVEGKLTEHTWDNEEGDSDKEFIVIETNTDSDQIPVKDVRKIYLKEKKE